MGGGGGRDGGDVVEGNGAGMSERNLSEQERTEVEASTEFGT